MYFFSEFLSKQKTDIYVWKTSELYDWIAAQGSMSKPLQKRGTKRSKFTLRFQV